MFHRKIFELQDRGIIDCRPLNHTVYPFSNNLTAILNFSHRSIYGNISVITSFELIIMSKIPLKILACIAMLLYLHDASGQLKPGAWYAEGEYDSKNPISGQMKQMGAEKKLVLNITESGTISGKLVTSYNRTNVVKPQEGFDQYYTLIGRIEEARNMLLLILTHMKTHPKEPESFLTFAKPDSLYYDLGQSPVIRHNKAYIEAVAHNPA
jgi:hypothetical protein